MDWSRPVSAVVPGLEGAVLRGLWARQDDELSGAQVHRVAHAGSSEGVRKALARLVQQGVVNRRGAGAGAWYRINTDHVCWPAIDGLFEALHPCRELRRQVENLLCDVVRDDEVRAEIGVALVGSAARGDGAADDDLDLLVVVPAGLEGWIAAELLDRLHRDVPRWTGNDADVHLATPPQLVAWSHGAAWPVLERWARDAEQLRGPPVHAHLPLVV
ncbi:nucleotidyltransferase domain-containing protein [Oerskovia jenensis]|uniref:Nucleotidyltransferase n=1 Tax=Oerskovia jenensis TaxID=162169 RepID=A0ABS2LFN6_9CELL|nr:nucleotidyltransferase domain-containing protein [Oerskovia jenensis]MBM7479102.1 putative nucleotidyltransferase [Oerskovia jenensis]